MENDNQISEPTSKTGSLGNLIYLSDYADNLVKQLASFSKLSEYFNHLVYSKLDLQEKLLESSRMPVDVQLALSQSMAFEFAESMQNMLKPLENINSILDNLIQPVIFNIDKISDRISERTRKSLMKIAKSGWFFDPHMSIASMEELEKALGDDNIESANLFLIEYFSAKSSVFEKRLKTRFPNRAKIIESAFSAHRRKEYVLSVPIFLIQADGICFDLLNKQLYSKKDNVSVAAYVKTITTDTFMSALLYPLTQPLPISASANERTESFNELNRHQVVHGESINYDTELNSLKAISLLNYVADVLSRDFANSDDEEI